MIPTKLTIKGLFSYQKEQVIDFDPLVSSQVFGVFGGVGSGKSSILDAITFALYGELDRLGQRDGRGYNMMNLKSNELLIDFEFITGAKEEKYRFVVSAKRNSKNFTEVKSFVRKSFRWTGESWLPLESINAENIIGISYQNFRRTVIIPQGKFQEFLQLGAKDRSQMLKEIFNLGKYDLSSKVGYVQKINNSRLDILEGELKHFANINKELLVSQEESLIQVIASYKELQQVYDDLILAIQKDIINQQLFDKKSNLEQELSKLKENKDTYKLLEEKISLLSDCLIHFKPILDRKEIVLVEIQTTEKSIKQISSDIDKNKKELSLKEIEFIKYKNIIDEKVRYYTEIEELNSIIVILKVNITISKTQSRLKKGNELVSKEAETYEKIVESEELLKNKLKLYRKNKPDYKLLAAINTWYHSNDNLSKESKDIENKMLLVQKDIDDLAKGFQEKIDIDTLSFVDLTIDKDELNSLLLSKISTLKTKQIDNRKESIKYETHLKLESYASALHVGDDCPVCGSLDHPNKLEKGNARPFLDLLEKDFSQGQYELLQLESILVAYEKFTFKNEEKTKLAESLRKNKAEIVSRCSEHSKSFIWTDFDSSDKQDFSKYYEKANQLELQIENSEKEWDLLQNKLTIARENIEKYRNGLKTIEQEQITDISTRDTLLDQLKYLSYDDFKLMEIPLLEKKGDLWLVNIQKAEQNYIRFDTDVDRINMDLGQLKGRHIEEKKQLDSLFVEKNSLEIKLENQLKGSKLNDVPQIVYLLNDAEQLDSNKQELQVYKTSLLSAEKQYKTIIEETKDIVYDHEILIKNQEKKSILKNQIATQQELQGKIKNDILSTQNHLKEKLRIEEESKQLSIRKENINTLKNLFKANGFVDYISSVYLEQLCNAANSRFYNLTKHQLKLELTDKNDFKVIDYLNDARERSVKTLSGGQTFQASLSLALSLAESVQHQSKSKQNFFFLDEGFGTQDKESLQVVFDTIKSLRKENRVVGIISHLEELQNEIDVFIQVKKDDELGSMITTSY